FYQALKLALLRRRGPRPFGQVGECCRRPLQVVLGRSYRALELPLALQLAGQQVDLWFETRQLLAQLLGRLEARPLRLERCELFPASGKRCSGLTPCGVG